MIVNVYCWLNVAVTVLLASMVRFCGLAVPVKSSLQPLKTIVASIRDNAFVFDLPENPVDGTPNDGLDYDTLEIDLTVTRLFPDRPFSLVAGVEYRDEDSSDPRFAYEREQVMVALQWEVGSGR